VTELLGRLLGLDDLQAVHGVQVRLGAAWAASHPALLLFGCLLLAAGAAAFYVRFQPLRGRRRAGMIALRALLLALLLTILAEPVISMTLTHHPKPLLVLLMDGTDSMNIRDKLSAGTRSAYKRQLGGDYDPPRPPRQDAPRIELLRKFLAHRDAGVLRKLADRFRLRCYLLDRPDEVRELPTSRMEAGRFDPAYLLEQLKGDCGVTALGEALNDIARRHSPPALAGAVVFSDFAWNHGRAPLEAAERLKVPLYTVGVGPREVVDLSAELATPLLLKKDEKAEVVVHIRQTGLAGRQATVELLARRMGGPAQDVQAAPRRAAEPKTVELTAEKMDVPVPFTPDQSGRFVLTARVQPFDDEALEENNSAQREVTVRDESLKLLFVEYEPTWEWRFIKEVFHRDPLVGREGFRTFLRSADFKVRQTNDLFLEMLIRPRSEFFSYDVIFLSDTPGEMLSGQFQDMLHDYVAKFGGGLVVIAGPRFGPAALKDTRVADMLPVVIDPAARLRDADFELQLAPAARQYEFMMLGDSREENALAWANMGELPWYQPVARPHPLATVLAQHPTDRCADEQTPQPIIAVRRFGKGEVIYFGFNETWRLRRKYGEKYYRQLWGQMIYRLGLGRALGSRKRFVVATDRRSYQAGDKVRLIVEAYNADYEPLGTPKLEARLLAQPAPGKPAAPAPINVPMARDKVIFEATFPVYAPGPHRLLVRDPVTDEDVETSFQVAPVTAERRSAVRDVAVQTALAGATGGKAYELTDLDRLADDIAAPKVVERTEHRFELWNTWAVLIVVLTVMLGEWLLRKLQNLR